MSVDENNFQMLHRKIYYPVAIQDNPTRNCQVISVKRYVISYNIWTEGLLSKVIPDALKYSRWWTACSHSEYSPVWYPLTITWSTSGIPIIYLASIIHAVTWTSSLLRSVLLEGKLYANSYAAALHMIRILKISRRCSRDEFSCPTCAIWATITSCIVFNAITTKCSQSLSPINFVLRWVSYSKKK